MTSPTFRVIIAITSAITAVVVVLMAPIPAVVVLVCGALFAAGGTLDTTWSTAGTCPASPTRTARRPTMPEIDLHLADYADSNDGRGIIVGLEAIANELRLANWIAVYRIAEEWDRESRERGGSNGMPMKVWNEHIGPTLFPASFAKPARKWDTYKPPCRCEESLRSWADDRCMACGGQAEHLDDTEEQS